jgi:predicted MFS family arabinose efflux permease
VPAEISSAVPITQGRETRRSVRALEWLNFFLADVQTGLGPFLAAYLSSSGWNPGKIGMALSLGGVITVALQTPAGGVVDASRHKRGILGVGVTALAVGALVLALNTTVLSVVFAQILIGGSAPFLAPTLAAITLGLVGPRYFDRQFGRNQGFNSAGNVFTALLVIAVSHVRGNRAIFVAAAFLAVPTWISIAAINPQQIDDALARGAKIVKTQEDGVHISGFGAVLADRVLLGLFVCACLFHLANAAMLPQLGEMLSRGNVKSAASFMAACVIVTQVVIMLSAAWISRLAGTIGRRPLLLVGFGVLPLRGLFYTLTAGIAPLIAIQILDGVANAVFGVVTMLVVADRTCGTGRFNLVQGALATVVGVGAALSTTIGGALIQHFSYRASFLGLGAIGLAAFLLLWRLVPETLQSKSDTLVEKEALP